MSFSLLGLVTGHGQERGVQKLGDLKRQHILDFVDRSLETAHSVVKVNIQVHILRGFLYRNAAVSKDLIRSRLKTIGKEVGVKVYPHRLKHTCATQLLNAGCRITSIQAFLGHKKLNTTLMYARAHDQTVAEDYFAAISRVEQRLEIAPRAEKEPETEGEIVKVPEKSQILTWIDLLALPELRQEQRMEIAESLKQALFLNGPGVISPP